MVVLHRTTLDTSSSERIQEMIDTVRRLPPQAEYKVPRRDKVSGGLLDDEHHRFFAVGNGCNV